MGILRPGGGPWQVRLPRRPEPLTGSASALQIVNLWSATFAQPSAFGNMPPALQSTVIALNSSTSVGGGSGTPSAGSWLFCITGMNEQPATAGFTVGDADDIHSFWRPGDVTTSTWAVSTSAALTRVSIWYTANLARTANDVYVAPNGAFDATSCLVVEVAGLGPWDVVTGINTNYAAAATSLNLALGAPSAASFMLAAIVGDNDSVSQAFAPAGWTTLPTVTATNGVDHTCDSVLTAAYLPNTSGSISVNGTTGSASDLSGVIIGVQINAPSPIPAGANPAWPGRVILEAGFGSGFETPGDQITWTTLSDSDPSWRAGNNPRFWGWNDDSGVPYTLGQLQSSHGTVGLDNFDSALSPGNAASPYFGGGTTSDVTTGTPIRLRCALGTIGGQTVNRWYTFSRNALEWPEKRNDAWRNWVELATTDVWSVASAACPSPFRGEVRQDNPYAWWPMDDQPLAGGVQPTSLRNAAAGNTNVLNVIASPNGVTAGTAYDTTGTGGGVAPSVATNAAGADPGWMYGDPQSSPASYATSNPVTASPGSAAWQQTGLLGNTGSNGWFLTCNDSNFPPLSGGVTLKGWFNAAFYATATGYLNIGTGLTHPVLGQPYANLTLATLSTGSAPVAILQFDRATGHLNLITYNGTTPTTHAIYTTSDLRTASWHSIDLQLTTTTWKVLVDGGLTASVSGTAAGMTSAWTWLTLCGDYGNTHGGSSPASIENGGNVAYGHWAVFGSILPAWRLLAHYSAAITGFGVLPAPQTVALSTVNASSGTTFTPDGSTQGGSYGVSGGIPAYYTFSGLAAAIAGSYTSGPSARAVLAGIGQDPHGTPTGDAVWMSWAALAPQVDVYTNASADAETEAAGVNGSGDSFTSGYGSGAVDAGVCAVSSGTGASPPSAPSSLGDTVAQRLERVLGYGGITYPNRAVDPAALAVQAALDVGGQQTGASCQNVVQSDNGMFFVDAGGTVCYRQKSHLASDAVVWNLSSAGPAYGIPFQPDQTFDSDPQRVWNVIQLQQYSPDGATLPVTTPTNATAENTSQQQYGPRPLPNATSYLQSSAEILSQANWYLAQFGTLHRRVASLTVDAAGNPAAFEYFFGASPGDLVQVTDLPMLGGPLTVGTYRISSISRRMAYGANGAKPEASITIVADAEPSSYWT